MPICVICKTALSVSPVCMKCQMSAPPEALRKAIDSLTQQTGTQPNTAPVVLIKTRQAASGLIPAGNSQLRTLIPQWAPPMIEFLKAQNYFNATRATVRDEENTPTDVLKVSILLISRESDPSMENSGLIFRPRLVVKRPVEVPMLRC